MKYSLVLVLILLINNPVLSQQTENKSILTENQNAEWIKEIEKITLKEEQLIKIKKKIISDSIYKRSIKYTKTGSYIIGDRVVSVTDEIIKEDRILSDCECKIQFSLKIRKDYYSLDINGNKKTIRVLELINNNNINKVFIDDTYKDAEFKTGMKWCGVILLNSKNRDLQRSIKNVL